MSLPPSARPSGREESASDEPPVDGLEELLRPRLSQRARQLRAGLLATLVAVVAAGLLWRSGSLGLLVPGPQNSTSVASSLVRITSNLSFGSVAVNGQHLGTLPAVARLRTGQNVVTLTASPFRPHTCLITWPGAESNDLACVVYTADSSQPGAIGQGDGAAGNVLNIQMVGADLAAQGCAQVLDSIEQALDAVALTTTVPAGQHVASGGFSPEGVPYSRIASAMLHGRLVVQPQAFAGRPCTSLQYGGSVQLPYAAQPPERAWGVAVPITEQMLFTQANGQVDGRTSAIQGQVNMTLAVPASGDAGWRLADIEPSISDQVAGGVCGAGVETLSDVFGRAHSAGAWSMSVSADHGLQGCRLELDASDNGVANAMNYLWSFGVLLAVDAAAHRALPLLPRASASELNAIPLDS